MKIDADKVSVRDVMQKDLVVLEMSHPIQRAIEMFEDYGISGAPVIDETESLCGVLTASDLLPVSTAITAAVSVRSSNSSESDELTEEESTTVHDFSPAVAGRGRVGDWMTPEILTVGPDATLGEVCCLMDRETVHRVFVADGKRLLGVVSTSDVVQYVAKLSSAWVGEQWR
jgi:CBS domain-containing protein